MPDKAICSATASGAGRKFGADDDDTAIEVTYFGWEPIDWFAVRGVMLLAGMLVPVAFVVISGLLLTKLIGAQRPQVG